MSRITRRALLASLALGCIAAAQAETLRCRSVNGNVTCAGSGAVACQTVNGRTICSSGGIVQEFGARPGAPPPRAGREAEPPEVEDAPEEDAPEEDRPPPRPRARQLTIERQGPAGRLFLERDGSRLRLRTDHQAVDLD
ncbi:hypothetical protein ACFQY5_16560 [Paeniroseomonas aquatica]|uniref:DUF4124 domain-containing protein n=1 Tax=Paeniroseomonas aquatica TaxID=373043 RepID=A0ABT8AGL9_9PROT|nr:hypothetical protein [Paeniroseomonas aquatica]MDN3568499.1 hypothetical protein [Paeniroseomonas aquatica]